MIWENIKRVSILLLKSKWQLFTASPDQPLNSLSSIEKNQGDCLLLVLTTNRTLKHFIKMASMINIKNKLKLPLNAYLMNFSGSLNFHTRMKSLGQSLIVTSIMFKRSTKQQLTRRWRFTSFRIHLTSLSTKSSHKRFAENPCQHCRSIVRQRWDI